MWVKVKYRLSHITGGESVVGQVGRYGIVVVGGYLLAISFYSAELGRGVAPYFALAAAFSLNGLFNFVLLRAWAFPPSGRTLGSDLSRFCAVAGVSFVVNYASFAGLYSAIGLHAATAQRLAIVIAAPVTFLANRLWAFRRNASGGESQSSAGERIWSGQDACCGAADDVPDGSREDQACDAEDGQCLEAPQAGLVSVDRVGPAGCQHQHCAEQPDGQHIACLD
jgi:putative flippase GtrA